jgi:predicted HAD superfamily hydrolase
MISNVEKLKKLSISDEIKIVSFDIFDTLLIRKIDPPDEVKRIASFKTVTAGLISIPPSQLLSLRNAIESNLRLETKQQTLDPECSIEEIIEHLLKDLDKDCSLKEKILDIELQVEKSLVAPMPGIESLLIDFKGKYKLIAISDTYLTKRMLKELLNSSGLGDFFEEIYSSCEYKLGKGSGGLFKKILELEQIDKSQIIHIGDNFLSDYFVPKSIGVNAILLYEEWNLKRKSLLRTLSKKEKQSTFWKGYSSIYRLCSIEQEKDIEDWEIYSWGKNILGPLLTTFIHILTIEIKNRNFQRLYFIAREGFLLKKLFNMFSKELHDGSSPKPIYLSTSRYTSFVASITTLTEREFKIATWGENLQIKDVIYRLGIQDLTEIKGLLAKHDIDPFEYLRNNKVDKSVYDLFTDPAFAHVVTCNSKIMRDLFAQYLRQIDFFSHGGDIALIDTGWAGTIQDCIEYTFYETHDFPTISGYYLALNPPIVKSTSNKKGLIYDYRKSYPEEMFITFFREALEFSCRAYHGTTIGYKRLENGRIIPLFRRNSDDRVREERINKHVLLIQKGIIDFAKEYLKLVKVLDIDPIELKPFVTKLYDLYLSFPSKEYVNTFEQIANTDDFGSENIKNIVRDFSFKEIIKPKSFIQSLIASPWREASLNKIGIPFLLTFYYLAKRFICWIRIKRYINGEKDSF